MKFIKKTVTALTVIAIILNFAVFVYADGYSTIKVKNKTTVRLSYNNITLDKITGTYTKYSNTYSENAYTVTVPKDSITSVRVTSGNSIYGKSTLSKKIADYNAGGGRVVAAINGDFFSTATGIPLGLQISDSIVKATNNYTYEQQTGRYSIGFKADGTAVVGQPNIKLSITVDGTTLIPDRINSYPDTNFVALTSDYSNKTYWNSNIAHDVVTLKIDGALTLGTDVTCSYVSFDQGLYQPIDIKQGYIYLVVPFGSTVLSSFAKGKTDKSTGVATVKDMTGIFNDVVSAIGGGNLLVNNGVIRYPSTYDSTISNMYTSRSAIGIKADGSVVLYAVERDSKKEKSYGVWMEAVAQAMYDMGCVYAVNLDGGGSTTIAASEDGKTAKVINRPQDGTERAVSNCILIVCNEAPPVVIEDFENTEYAFNERYSGTNLITASVTREDAYTGNGSLKLDYSLAGVGNSVGADLVKPIDVSNYQKITLTVFGDKAGNELYINFGEKTQKLCDIDFEGYRHFEIDVTDALTLVGFDVKYKIASRNRSFVLIDRITGYNGYSLTDTAAPELTVSTKDTVLTALSKDGLFESGPDKTGYYFTADGTALTPNFKNGAATADLSDITGNKIIKTVVDSTDIFGNRARKIQPVKSVDYSKISPFVDVKDGKWDELYIKYCAENGIINGFEQTDGTFSFKGSNSITRTQFCAMIVRKQGIDITKYTGVKLPYEDVDSIPKWAILYVKAAYAEGIMTGSATYTGIAFNGGADITRAEAATCIYRITPLDTRLAMQIKYTDAADVPNFAKQAVTSVTAMGIFGGNPDGGFYPKKSLSRSEAAAIMMRI